MNSYNIQIISKINLPDRFIHPFWQRFILEFYLLNLLIGLSGLMNSSEFNLSG